MAFFESNGLRAYQFELFQDCDIVQGIFTRRGGISPAPWASLNLGGTVGDERANVVENRRRIFAWAERPVESIFDVWQVHGTKVVCSREPRPLDSPHQPADAILTDNPEITLFMRFADCVPIFLHDPQRKVVGVVHAGWKGTVNKIVAAAILAMQSEYNCAPENILAGIGPSISRSQYEVGLEVVEQVKLAFDGNSTQMLDENSGRTFLDLWQANRCTLEDCGLRPEHIQIAGICTAQNMQDWFSHRGEKGKTGRFGALIALNS
jgi:YfiH family protein